MVKGSAHFHAVVPLRKKVVGAKEKMPRILTFSPHAQTAGYW